MKSFLVIIVCSFCFSFTGANIISIPGEYPDIRSGLDAASEGDTLLVAPGVYGGINNRELTFPVEGLVLISSGGPDVTTIDGEWNGRLFVWNEGTASTGTVTGFTIQRGNGDQQGGAVSSTVGTQKFEGCIFVNNKTSHYGGAMYFTDGAEPVITNCKFIDNYTTGGASYAGAIGAWGASPYIDNCEFISNRSMGYGGAIFYAHGGTPTLLNSRFESNSTIHGGAFGHYAVSGVIEGCEFLRNTASQKGGAVFLQDNCSPTIKNCTFYGNSGATGGVFYIQERFSFQKSAAIFENVLVAYNTNDPAFAVVGSNALPEFSCINIFGNAADWTGYLSSFAGTNGNISLAPLFCDTANGNLHVNGDSPCAPANNSCNSLIGAKPAFCVPDQVTLLPNPMYAYFKKAIDTLFGECYINFTDNQYSSSDVVLSSIRINSTLVPTSITSLSLDGDFDILNLEYNVTEFINGYELWWGTSEETVTISGLFADNSEFEYVGDFQAIGHTPGDINGNGEVNVGDVVYLINFIFRDGESPPDMIAAEVNCDDEVNVGDAVTLVRFIFRNGPAPGCQ